MMIWCDDYRDELYTDAVIRDLALVDAVAIMFGRSVAADFPRNLEIVIRSKNAPTDFFMTGEFPIVSDKLKAILDHFEVAAEYFPVKLAAKAGKRVFRKKWFCFNLLTAVDCLDRKKSVFVNEKGWATKISRLAIINRKIGDKPVALVANTLPMLIVVQDSIAQRSLESGCTGVIFKSPSDWRNNAYPGT